MRSVCWCGHTAMQHTQHMCYGFWGTSTYPFDCYYKCFDNTEATWQAYHAMYLVAKKDYDNNYSMWKRFVNWLWK
jgi:hypothetical protein